MSSAAVGISGLRVNQIPYANVQYVYIVKAKYQIATPQAVVGVDWLVYALSYRKHISPI